MTLSSWQTPDIQERRILPGTAICEWCNDACDATVSLFKWKTRAHQLIVNQFHLVRMATQRMGMAKDLPYPDREAVGYQAPRHSLFGSGEIYPAPQNFGWATMEKHEKTSNKTHLLSESAQHHRSFSFKFHPGWDVSLRAAMHERLLKMACSHLQLN